LQTVQDTHHVGPQILGGVQIPGEMVQERLLEQPVQDRVRRAGGQGDLKARK